MSVTDNFVVCSFTQLYENAASSYSIAGCNLSLTFVVLTTLRTPDFLARFFCCVYQADLSKSNS